MKGTGRVMQKTRHIFGFNIWRRSEGEKETFAENGLFVLDGVKKDKKMETKKQWTRRKSRISFGI